MNLDDQALGESQMGAVNACLQQNRQVVYLSLRNNGIYAAGLATLLSSLSRLECLDLKFNKIGEHYNNGQSGLGALRDLAIS